jgi:hypothetical protein
MTTMKATTTEWRLYLATGLALAYLVVFGAIGAATTAARTAPTSPRTAPAAPARAITPRAPARRVHRIRTRSS